MRRALLYGAAIVMALGAPGKAAQFDIKPLDSGIPVLWITGTIAFEDFDNFSRLANPLTGKTVIALESTGGNLVAAIRIGEYVRLKGWATFVYGECDSSCAAIWLAGTPRLMSPFAKIGFHASSIDGQEKGTGNALFGAYMNRLGLGYAAVGWATSASPQDISYLTPAKAKELGIDVTVLGDKEKQADTRPTTPPVGPPIRLTPQAPTISAVHTPPRTLGNLHLRVAPDPRAADALPPDQFIPKGTTLSISPRSCTVWMGSGRGAQDADNVWCPTTYGTTSGWVNAYYIAADKWEPVACELYPSARGCESE